MCCFTGMVRQVSDTDIFARSDADGVQFLAYRMTVDAAQAVAMVLPMPVADAVRATALSFIDLSGYEGFFEDLNGLFPVPASKSPPFGFPGMTAAPRSMLPVLKVGSFEASYVPSPHDFDRLDPRFRLPQQAWAVLAGRYRDFGFAVFQLSAGSQRPHPMAFRFVRANPGQVFLPTVHVHDGTVPDFARFDHALYVQARPGESLELKGWTESGLVAGQNIDKDRAHGLVDPDQHVYRRYLSGPLLNEDTVVNAREGAQGK